jgi:hypothetical protein
MADGSAAGSVPGGLLLGTVLTAVIVPACHLATGGLRDEDLAARVGVGE